MNDKTETHGTQSSNLGHRQTAYSFLSMRIQLLEERLVNLREFAVIAKSLETNSPAERALWGILLDSKI
jgi:hypothetical protein